MTLLWAGAADLDLYVTGPDAVSVYFARPRGPAGALDADTTCAHLPPGGAGSERVALAALAPGTYRVGVDYAEACVPRAVAVAFRVVADVGDDRHEVTGSIVAQELRARALEFTVPAGGSPPR